MKPNTILYVEDEPDDVFFMRSAFRRVGAPCDLRVVEDGAKAIAYLAGEAPFAVRSEHPLPQTLLLDLNLPLRSGFEVLQWLRNNPAFRDLKVFVFSSSGRPEDRARASQLGANGYLQKPSSGAGFVEIARQVTEALGIGGGFH